MKAFALLAAASLVLTACATTGPTSVDLAPVYAAAVANPARADEERKLDASRKPAETLAFLGLRPGMRAADLITGSGYWARLMASVVGPGGSVTAFQPEQFYKAGEEKAKLDALIAASPGVTLARYPFENFAPPANAYDFALINLSYHDLYWESAKYGIPRTDPAGFARGLYAAMRPGAVVGVIDHVGPAGDTRAIVDKLHRIDPAVVRADFERAGFRLEAESPLLANPADDHSKLVFDPAIRGQTDRFFYKFRKPRR
ncbi:class I SAM-dependent methyltransferase [Sphingomonas astaxanthinifaciens]|uniref:Methyltransferase n=1 Tax=Sphingomonas astaxanthinifaciens DSM 22298 TaxID=1123267 RepID=A0ABQ5Z3H0_9SPHN|nr:class I SAM-dependent methyltransferase [Sphingomonas astaxanthinifaciens]GLR46504.1 methyltransferase [Sphingomonas astaxanthinifaciens DSM 22298]